MVKAHDQRKYSFTATLKLCLLCLSSICLKAELQASQWGPVFPSHRYPTDKSFHLNTSLSYGSQSGVFDSEGVRQDMPSTLTRFRLNISPEYQPTRQLSLGAYIHFDSLKLDAPTEQLSKSGLSDQYLFGEFRVVDEVGYSVGFGTVFKIPLYSNPTDVGTGTESFLMLGDGQIDAALYFTTEYWAWPQIKLVGDLGINFRTDEHATEVPFQLGMEYMSPKTNFGVSVLGNLSLKNDKATQTPTSQQLQNLTGNTNYVFATNPESVIIQVKGEYSMSHSWGLIAKFENSLWGKNSPAFMNISAGLSYRLFDPYYSKRSAREVGIETDDSSSEFEGEAQEKVEDEKLQNDSEY